MQDANTVTVVGKLLDKDVLGKEATSKMSTSDSGKKNAPETSSCIMLACSPCAYICKCSSLSEESSVQQMSEEGMFYCSLCEVEV